MSLSAQIRDSIYQKIPWKECFDKYNNFFDFYKNQKINPLVFNFTDVGILYCDFQTKIRIFLKNNEGRKEVILPKDWQNIPVLVKKFFYNPQDSTFFIFLFKFFSSILTLFLFL